MKYEIQKLEITQDERMKKQEEKMIIKMKELQIEFILKIQECKKQKINWNRK